MASIFDQEILGATKTRIGISGDYDINSNTITNSFLKKFYTGGYIDNEFKKSVSDRLKNSNRIGGNVNVGVYGSFKLNSINNSKEISLFFAVKDRTHIDAQFSRDFFNIGFYGNSKFAGKTADLNDFSLNFIRYQQLQMGVFSSKLDSAARWGIGISFLNGEQYLSVLAKKAELYTSEDGQYIDFTTDMFIAKSDAAKNGLGAVNGFGSSVDLFFEAPFKTRMGNSYLRLSVSDIGFINFNKKTLTLEQDSIFHFTGFQINNFSDLHDSTFGAKSKDSILNGVAPFKKQSFSATLPAVLDFNFETHFSKYFHLTEGFRYVFNGNYSLLVYLKSNFYFNPKFMLSLTLGYGGYGNLNYGIGLKANLGNGFLIYAGSNNIEGYISPKNTGGQGVFFSLGKQF